MSDCVEEKALLFNVDDVSVGKVVLDLSLCRTLFDTAVEGIGIRGNVRVDAELKRQGEDIILTGTLSVPLEMVCSRCLKRYNVDSKLAVGGVFREKEEEETEENIDESSPDISLYDSDKIDLFPLLRDQIYLSIPMKPLCSEACKGVCPECGANRNSEVCDCVSDDIDPRLVVLKSLRGNT